MGRNFPANLQTILGGAHDAHWLLDLTFPTRPAQYFASKPMSYLGNTYSNKLTSVRELRQTLEAPLDRVSIELANHDTLLGKDWYQYQDEWAQAVAILRRQYTGQGLTETIIFFNGAVYQPNVQDTKFTTSLIPDVIAAGRIVCSRTLSQLCQYKFKDAKTCGYSGGLTTCNRQLESSGGCDGRANSFHFGGMEHRYNPDITVPGTGGNTDPGGGGGGVGTGGGGGYCPRHDQFVLARGAAGDIVAKFAGQLTTEDWLWNPVSGEFHKMRSIERAIEQIWKLELWNGAHVYASRDHRVIEGFRDSTGKKLCSFREGEFVLAVTNETARQTRVTEARNTYTEGQVIKIELEDGHIYCAGGDSLRLIAAHNRKPLEE